MRKLSGLKGKHMEKSSMALARLDSWKIWEGKDEVGGFWDDI